MIAVRSGKTAAERSRKVSGVSGWKFAGFLSRSRSYGVIGAALGGVAKTYRSATGGGSGRPFAAMTARARSG